MQTPGWWDNAVGGLVTTGILGLLPAWWKFRKHRWALLLPAAWLLLVGLVCYYAFRGWLVVPSFLFSSVPAWTLLVAVLVGALCVLVGVSVARRASETNGASDEAEGEWILARQEERALRLVLAQPEDQMPAADWRIGL